MLHPKLVLASVLLLSAPSIGCAAKQLPALRPQIPAGSRLEAPDLRTAEMGAARRESENSSKASSALSSWDNLAGLAPGSRVAVYLENGGRMVQKFLRFTDTQILLDINGFDRNQVVAVALAPQDRLRNGVLIGSGTGVVVGLVIAGAAGGGGDARALSGSSLVGFGIGAGLGALWDAGLATPEKPIYLRDDAGQSLTPSRRWQFTVPPHRIARWVVGKKTQLMLKDGTYVKGKVRQGSEREIEIDVADSSDKKFKRGKLQILTETVSTIVLRENIGGNRLAATVGGGLTGLFSGFLLGALRSDAVDETGLVVGGAVGTLLGSLSVLAAAEYRNWREITIIVK